MRVKQRKINKKIHRIYEGINELRVAGLNETQIAQLALLRIHYNPDFDKLSVQNIFFGILHRQYQLLEDTTASLAFAYGCPLTLRPPERLNTLN